MKILLELSALLQNFETESLLSLNFEKLWRFKIAAPLSQMNHIRPFHTSLYQSIKQSLEKMLSSSSAMFVFVMHYLGRCTANLISRVL